ncbi:unnamed protein product [Cyclocybe aegerita]|uniref:GP-PDE domain-containing protein n=1 Tax=Cyclocybe aegerita TaxID=1973307 RepID=A0A8S0WJI8_CYCAE|nr:unnamed protein product [Cyclocybe aegerita]
MQTLSLAVYVLSAVAITSAGPVQQVVSKPKPFDVQGHRGTRGQAVESTLPAFAWALIDGVTTLELDNGITKDGAVLVWHDEEITADKCKDTAPVVKDDPDFPYVGKRVANLTLAQIKTLDCGSARLLGFPLQLSYPGTKLSTLDELFEFATCVDTKRELQWNIESKINPISRTSTRGVDDFVTLQHQAFVKSTYKLSQITYQSFDWRTLIKMKALEPRIPTAALVSEETLIIGFTAGLNVFAFEGATLGEKIANAAYSIKASILSPSATSGLSLAPDPAQPGYIPFTTKAMIDQAHKNGMLVKPWTVNRVSIAEQLFNWGVDGIITDYPTQIRRFIQQRGQPVASPFSEATVMRCLKKHLQTV